MSDQKNEKTLRKELLKKRTYAFYADLTIIAILQKFLVMTYINCVQELLTTLPRVTSSHLLDHTYQLALPTLTFTLFSYFFCCYYFNHGTTLGKAVLNLRVYNEKDLGQELNLFECITRSLVYSICYLGGGLLLAIPFLRKDSKGLPDYFSKTQVTTLDHYQQLIQIQYDSNQKQLLLFAA
jgi:uncharacterized RDD family membrane protein YckC